MTEAKQSHTSGPWKEFAGHVYKPGDDGANICSMSELRASSEVRFTEPDVGSPNMAEIHANARLIAAAPEMLSALQSLLPAAVAKSDETGNPSTSFLEACAMSRAAIARATGETP